MKHGLRVLVAFQLFLFGREFLKRDSSLFLLGIIPHWAHNLLTLANRIRKKNHGQISCRSRTGKWSLQILHCIFVTLPSFLILAILIYSVPVSREKINLAKTAAFPCNCLCRKGLLSIFSCKSLASSLKSTRTPVAANKRDLKCGSLGANSVWNVTYLSVLHYIHIQHMLAFYFGACFFPNTLDRALFPWPAFVPGKPQLLGMWSWSRGREGPVFSAQRQWKHFGSRLSSTQLNALKTHLNWLVTVSFLPIEIRVP